MAQIFIAVAELAIPTGITTEGAKAEIWAHWEIIVYAFPKRENEDEIDKKIYKLETPVEIDKQPVEDKKQIIKSELEQKKVDIQIAKEPDIKKIQDVFDKVKEEEPINVENFYINDNYFFNSEEIYNSDREFIIDLINRTNFIADAKRFAEESNVPKIEIVHPEGKKLRRKNECQLMMTKREKMQALEIVWWKK